MDLVRFAHTPGFAPSAQDTMPVLIIANHSATEYPLAPSPCYQGLGQNPMIGVCHHLAPWQQNEATSLDQS